MYHIQDGQLYENREYVVTIQGFNPGWKKTAVKTSGPEVFYYAIFQKTKYGLRIYDEPKWKDAEHIARLLEATEMKLVDKHLKHG
jgi:hypothetical protein